MTINPDYELGFLEIGAIHVQINKLILHARKSDGHFLDVHRQSPNDEAACQLL